MDAVDQAVDGVFIGLAVLNEVIWRTQSTDTWVLLQDLWPNRGGVHFFMTQGKIFQDYALEEEADEG